MVCPKIAGKNRTIYQQCSIILNNGFLTTLEKLKIVISNNPTPQYFYFFLLDIKKFKFLKISYFSITTAKISTHYTVL